MLFPAAGDTGNLNRKEASRGRRAGVTEHHDFPGNTNLGPMVERDQFLAAYKPRENRNRSSLHPCSIAKGPWSRNGKSFF